MEIIHLSAECYPVAKVGGLADVVGALPKYLVKSGIDAKVIMPCYETKFIHSHDWEFEFGSTLEMGSRNFDFSVYREKGDHLGFELYVIRIPDLIEGETIYSGLFDTERFLGFQIAALNWLISLEKLPDIIHCHDHHTGLIPFMMYHVSAFEKLKNIPTVFTIHSGQYQGQFGWEKQSLLPPYDPLKFGLLEWNEMINPMACAIKCAWKFTTVSQGYLQELQHNALGLESLILDEKEKSLGIVNGIDATVWNPEKDKDILFKYSAKDITRQKPKNKEELCRIFNLDATKPLIVFIGRLVGEKGADLLPEVITRTVSDKNNICFLVLGSGADPVEDALRKAKDKTEGFYNCFIGYNEKLSHLMYAGADFLLMPSRVEPCGLNQLYAMRYGTVPVVRSTGGLKDTVEDLDEKEGFGIRFENAEVNDILKAIHRCNDLYHDTKKFAALRKQLMRIDHSWEKSAIEYIDLYESLMANGR
jgi:starch synthase